MAQRVFTQVFGVVAALIERDSKFLLVKEAKAGPDTGKWNHPAGWIDVGENPVDAVKREVEEETGFTFTPKSILGIYSLVRKDIAKEMPGTPHALKIIFLGDISQKAEKELHDDVSETKWFTPEEIYAMEKHTLRDMEIKQMAKDYMAGISYPLALIYHHVQE
ncbi:MAG TPA: NUDIX domain-containing protein [Candidatus Paceibacterota bacterium]